MAKQMRQVEYKKNAEGKWGVEPQPDDVLVIYRKVYKSDGSIESETLFFQRPEITGYRMANGCLHVHKANVMGRPQITYYPLSELIMFHVIPPTDNWNKAWREWHIEHYGMTVEEREQVENNRQDSPAVYMFGFGDE